MKRLVLVLVLVLAVGMGCSKEEEQKKELAAAQASASAAAAQASAALAAQLAASASAKPKEEPPAGEWITAQHILVAYKGARAAPRDVTRTKEEAKKRAQEAHDKASDPKLDFTDLVNIYSDDSATKDRQGSLGKIKKTSVVKEFADAAWALKVDGVSDPIETPFGFHVIKRNQ